MKTGNSSTAIKARSITPNRLVTDLKEVFGRVEDKAIDSGKAADKLIRGHPYQTIGLALGIGLFIGALFRRRA